MKNRKKLLVSIILCVLLSVCGCSFESVTDVRSDPDEEAYEVITDQTIEDEISSFNIECNSGNVEIIAGDYDVCRVVESVSSGSSGKSRLSCSVEDGSLVIAYKGKNVGINISDKEKLEIYCPDKNYESVVFSGSSGSFQTDGLKATSLNVKNGSGATKLRGSFTEVAAKTGSGSMEIECVTMPDVINLNGSSGSFNLALPENDGFLLKINQAAGSIDSDFSLLTTSDRNYLYGNGESQITAKMVSGSIRLTRLSETD